MTFKHRTRIRKVSHVGTCKRIIPGIGNYMCKGPEAGVCLVCSRKTAQLEWRKQWAGVAGDEVRAVAGSTQNTQNLAQHSVAALALR